MPSKPLLTDQNIIRRAVERLHANGIYGRDLYQWLVDFAHIDLDVLNEVLVEIKQQSEIKQAA